MSSQVSSGLLKIGRNRPSERVHWAV